MVDSPTPPASILDLATLSWGDKFFLALNEGERAYTVLVVYNELFTAKKRVVIVCFEGEHDLTAEVDIGAREEIYIAIEHGPQGPTRETLEGKDREHYREQFHFFFLLVGAIRTTATTQPIPSEPVNGKLFWKIVLNEETTLLVQRVLSIAFGELEENIADIFMGSIEAPDDVPVESYLVFLEVLQEEPRKYGPIAEEDRDALFTTLMAELGYDEYEEEDGDDVSASGSDEDDLSDEPSVPDSYFEDE